MDNNKLNEVIKGIDRNKLDRVREMLSGGGDISELLSRLDAKKAESMMKEFNLKPSGLGSIIKEIKKNPELLNEIKNKLE